MEIQTHSQAPKEAGSSLIPTIYTAPIQGSPELALGAYLPRNLTYSVAVKDIDDLEQLVKTVTAKIEHSSNSQEFAAASQQRQEGGHLSFEAQALIILQKINTYSATVLKNFKAAKESLIQYPNEVLTPPKLEAHRKRVTHYTQVFSIVEEIIQALTYSTNSTNANNSMYSEMNRRSTLLFCKKQIDQIFVNMKSKNNQQQLLLKFYYFGDKFIHVYNPMNLVKLYKVKCNIDVTFSKLVITRDSRLFVTGDYIHPSTFRTKELDMAKMEFVNRTDMLNDRRSHAFEELKSNYLLVTGGYVTECEVYDVIRDSWAQISSLNHRRGNHSIMVFEEKIVYSFGGDWNCRQLLTYEKLTINENFSGSWQMIEFDPVTENTPISFNGCLKLNESEFLLFGGWGAQTALTKDCAIFDAANGVLRAAPYSLSATGLFQNSSMMTKSNGANHFFSFTNSTSNPTLHSFNGKKWIHMKNFVKEFNYNPVEPPRITPVLNPYNDSSDDDDEDDDDLDDEDDEDDEELSLSEEDTRDKEERSDNSEGDSDWDWNAPPSHARIVLFEQ